MRPVEHLYPLGQQVALNQIPDPLCSVVHGGEAVCLTYSPPNQLCSQRRLKDRLLPQHRPITMFAQFHGSLAFRCSWLFLCVGLCPLDHL